MAFGAMTSSARVRCRTALCIEELISTSPSNRRPNLDFPLRPRRGGAKRTRAKREGGWLLKTFASLQSEKPIACRAPPSRRTCLEALDTVFDTTTATTLGRIHHPIGVRQQSFR